MISESLEAVNSDLSGRIFSLRAIEYLSTPLIDIALQAV